MYTDPTFGGILASILTGALVAVSGVFFIFSRRIKEGIARLRRRARNDEDKEDVEK